MKTKDFKHSLHQIGLLCDIYFYVFNLELLDVNKGHFVG